MNRLDKLKQKTTFNEILSSLAVKVDAIAKKRDAEAARNRQTKHFGKHSTN